MDFENKYRPAI
jgi:hypothetical protein